MIDFFFLFMLGLTARDHGLPETGWLLMAFAVWRFLKSD